MAESGQELIHRAWQAMSKFSLDRGRKAEVSDALGLSWTRVLALRRLATQSQTLRGLAEHLSADPSYVTLIVDDLEERGLVLRTPHPTDRRAKVVELTDDGRATALRADAIMDSPPAALLDVSVADLEAILRVHLRLENDEHRQRD